MNRAGKQLRVGFLLFAAALFFGVPKSHAALIDLGPGSFTPLAPVITFSEVPLGTVDPVYSFLAIPGLGNVDVSFGGYFVGQAVCVACFPVTLADTTPTGPLALDPAAPDTFTGPDAAFGATPPILSGTPLFNGVIAVHFSVPVAAVGLKGGFFDAVGSTTIEAYDAAGVSLGSIVNTVTGFEFYGLADSGGANVISGISFYITGPEPAGFEIDDLTFGSAEQLAPEPGSLMLLSAGLLGLAGYYRGRRKEK